MPYANFRFLLLIIIALQTVSCIRYGDYRYGGAFVNARLPVEGKKIGILEPRGPFGDAEAKRVMYNTLIKTLGKCPNTYVATEDGLHDRGELPPIYGDQLSEENMAFFVEKTSLDFLLFLDVGPGKVVGGAVLDIPSAHQEVSVILTIYDLNQGDIFQEIIVNGALDFDPDLQLWEIEATPKQMGMMALKKALHRVRRFSDCR